MGMVHIAPIRMVIWGMVYGIVLPTLGALSDQIIWDLTTKNAC